MPPTLGQGICGWRAFMSSVKWRLASEMISQSALDNPLFAPVCFKGGDRYAFHLREGQPDRIDDVGAARNRRRVIHSEHL